MCIRLAAVRSTVKQALVAGQPDLQVSAQGSITGAITWEAALACLQALLPNRQVVQH